MKGNFKFGCPFIFLEVEGKRVELLLDTDFNGSIILPKRFIDELGSEKRGLSDYTTVSGEERITEIYKGKISILGEEKEVIILSTEGDFYLAGMGLFDDYKIVIEKKNSLLEITKI